MELFCNACPNSGPWTTITEAVAHVERYVTHVLTGENSVGNEITVKMEQE